MSASKSPTTEHRKARIGQPLHNWLHSTRTGFDLSHLASDTKFTLQTTTNPITISAAKSALVIIDMQNYFLSPALGRLESSAGHRACLQLIEHAIPAARKVGMRIVWVNWGLTETEVRTMPPAVTRAFGFEAVGEGAVLVMAGSKLGTDME
jgi:hypothetical protein